MGLLTTEAMRRGGRGSDAEGAVRGLLLPAIADAVAEAWLGGGEGRGAGATGRIEVHVRAADGARLITTVTGRG